MNKICSTLVLFLAVSLAAIAQQNKVPVEQEHDHRGHNHSHDQTLHKDLMDKAGWYSMILPGAGQVYNRQYWKAPIAFAAVAIPIKLHLDFRKYRQHAQQAIEIIADIKKTGNEQFADNMHADFRQKFDELKGKPNGYDEFRDIAFRVRRDQRRYMDYSIACALLFWCANIADATAFGHLRSFEVGDNITLKVSPEYFHMSNTPGVKLAIGRKD